MARVREQRVGRALLDHLAGVHHGHLVGPAGDHAEVVGDQDDGHAEVASQRVDEVEDLRLDGDVEGGRGLVGDEQLGLAGQGDGDHHPLPHAARELVRVVVDPGCGARDPRELEDLDGAGASRPPGHRAVQQHRLGDLVADGHGRVQGGQRVLEDHADALAADLLHRLVVEGHEVAPVEADRSARDGAAGRKQTHDREGGHRLAAARLPDQSEGLAGVQREVDALDGVHRPATQADVGGEPGDLEQW